MVSGGYELGRRPIAWYGRDGKGQDGKIQVDVERLDADFFSRQMTAS